HLKQATRILSLGNNTRGKINVVTDFADVQAVHEDESAAIPTNVELMADLRSNCCLDRVKGMIDFCGHPELVEYEALELLKELKCVREVMLVAKHKDAER